MIRTTTTAVLAAVIATVTTFGAQAAILNHVPGQKQPGPTFSQSSGECYFTAYRHPLIRAAEISSVKPTQQVWLTPVCEDMLDRNSYGTLFRDGNVDTLRNVIAGNPALMAALSAGGYDQFDVVAVRFSSDDSVNLFVHQRDMR